MAEAGTNIGVPPLETTEGHERPRVPARASSMDACRRRRSPRRWAFDLAEVSPGFALFTMTPAVQALQSDRRRARRRGRDAARQLHELRRADAPRRPAPATRRSRSRSTWCGRSPTRPDRSAPKAARCTSAAAPRTAEGKILDAERHAAGARHDHLHRLPALRAGYRQRNLIRPQLRLVGEDRRQSTSVDEQHARPSRNGTVACKCDQNRKALRRVDGIDEQPFAPRHERNRLSRSGPSRP